MPAETIDKAVDSANKNMSKLIYKGGEEFSAEISNVRINMIIQNPVIGQVNYIAKTDITTNVDDTNFKDDPRVISTKVNLAKAISDRITRSWGGGDYTDLLKELARLSPVERIPEGTFYYDYEYQAAPASMPSTNQVARK